VAAARRIRRLATGVGGGELSSTVELTVSDGCRTPFPKEQSATANSP
jgi:hypothetical protein